ncbi:MAG: acyltransferase, partial [Candidatus Eremiobacteraeota bacterium]|nr:acyltransferase [Candidatus Eremiobacteraeota bacterium]
MTIARRGAYLHPNLDYLRAFAVLCVVGSHWCESMGWLERLSKLFGGTQLGHTGVLLFFVHTSCVLMMSLERLPPANGWQTTLRFYVRRAFRIYPLSTVTLCLVLFFHFPSYMGNNFSPPTWLILVTNFTLTQNLFDH